MRATRFLATPFLGLTLGLLSQFTFSSLKLVSAIFYQIFIYHQMIALQKI